MLLISLSGCFANHPKLLVQSSQWLVDKVVELARLTLLLFKPPKRKTRNVTLSRVSLAEHEGLIVAAGSDTVIAETDGSASPNPGASGELLPFSFNVLLWLLVGDRHQ